MRGERNSLVVDEVGGLWRRGEVEIAPKCNPASPGEIQLRRCWMLFTLLLHPSYTTQPRSSATFTPPNCTQGLHTNALSNWSAITQSQLTIKQREIGTQNDYLCNYTLSARYKLSFAHGLQSIIVCLCVCVHVYVCECANVGKSYQIIHATTQALALIYEQEFHIHIMYIIGLSPHPTPHPFLLLKRLTGEFFLQPFPMLMGSPPLPGLAPVFVYFAERAADSRGLAKRRGARGWWRWVEWGEDSQGEI